MAIAVLMRLRRGGGVPDNVWSAWTLNRPCRSRVARQSSARNICMRAKPDGTMLIHWSNKSASRAAYEFYAARRPAHRIVVTRSRPGYKSGTLRLPMHPTSRIVSSRSLSRDTQYFDPSCA